ncbi:myotubularin-related protein 9 [Mytilus galloprovincialis]|uniref:Myotubularin-related protein 9 n=1 Tax=Mytilus galloprovincialis TaxID=29158 RepID=A0A8B6GS20_MYTGA|nr:myotubularin-related protein 9 [Mytilus galloprovincialis]
MVCDRQLNEGWYIAKHQGEILRMPTSCPSALACGTSGGIWLNGEHPTDVNTTITVNACRRGFTSDANECCAEMIPIQVKNCGSFYAYNLKYTTGCSQAYCFGSHNCPVTTASTTTSTTTSNVVIVPDNKTMLLSTVATSHGQNIGDSVCMNVTALDGVSKRGTGCLGTELSNMVCDRQLFEGWYVARHEGKLLEMPTTCPSMLSCGTSGGIWLNGNHACPQTTTSSTTTQETAADNASSVSRIDLICSSAVTINAISKRGTGCMGTELTEKVCDRQLAEGWYYAEHEGNMTNMATSCPSIMSCGTAGSIWLNGEHPYEVYKTVAIDACRRGFPADGNECCVETFPIQVRNCGTFYAYYLRYTSTCDQAYCFGASVLVHGSEGFDTTLQVTSLVQLILDHDCRTINGFEALVEREWLQGGHPFADRCSKSAFAITKQRSESPIFLLFLDCVWQIWQQFPCSFEFNEEFLVLLFEHTYSSQFGTFLCNNEKERKECKLSSRTVSLWTYLARPEVLQKYLNPMYDPNPRVIWPSVAPQSLVLWSGLYQRSIIDQSKQKEAWQEVSKIREYDKELRSKVTKLRRQLASLEREALGVGLILPSELGVDCIPE